MSEAVAAVTSKSRGTRSPWKSPERLLILALAFVVGCRLLLYAWMPGQHGEFDSLYEAAARLVRGENPYPLTPQSFPYPLPAVLLAVPFTLIPPGLAGPVFDVLVGWALAFALWKYRGPYALLTLLSGAYLFGVAKGETTPLMVAASLIPPLGFLLAVKPNTSLALWIARPSWMGVLGVSLFLGLSLLVLPSWPRDWWRALPLAGTQLVPPLLRPFGFLLLLAALRWRLPEARIILGMACIPQSILPYELVSLALIPANRREMVIYLGGTWIAVAAASRLPFPTSTPAWAAMGWPTALCAVYLPMLYLVLRRPGGKTGPRMGKERRRAHRLSDDEIRVDITPNGTDGVIVRVTHLPTRLFASEAGQTREIAERKAQDRLAAILAGRAKGRERGPADPK